MTKLLFVANVTLNFMADDLNDAMEQLTLHMKRLTDGAENIIRVEEINLISYADKLDKEKDKA